MEEALEEQHNTHPIHIFFKSIGNDEKNLNIQLNPFMPNTM